MSTEVAEHLPRPMQTLFFLDNIARHGDLVAFSAAIPDQGGVHHVNEQWPDYWIEKFAARGYGCLDAIRHRIWDDPAIAFYYRQNLMFFATPAALAQHPELAEAAEEGFSGQALVHPGMWAIRNELDDLGLRRLGTAFGRGLALSVAFHAQQRRRNRAERRRRRALEERS